MNALVPAGRAADWHKLKALVLDSVSSQITRRVYNLGLDEFFDSCGQQARPGFTKATVAAWRVALEARGLGAVSINVRITAVRKLRRPTMGSWHPSWLRHHAHKGREVERRPRGELAVAAPSPGAPQRAGRHDGKGSAG